MRLGVIGVGKMGFNHVKIFSQMKDVQVVGVADVRTRNERGSSMAVTV